jgi:hypothetical protein
MKPYSTSPITYLYLDSRAQNPIFIIPKTQLQLILTHVDLLLGLVFPAFMPTCFFCTLEFCYSYFCTSFFFQQAKLPLHFRLLSSLSLFSALFSPLFFAKYVLTTHLWTCMFLYCALCSFLVFFLLLLRISSILRISMKIESKILVQQNSNINLGKYKAFLDKEVASSKSNSYKMKIHFECFPSIICWVIYVSSSWNIPQ